MANQKPKPQTQPAEKPLPHSQEAEQAVLGAILLNSEALRRVEETSIRPEDFFFDHHRRIFEVILGLDDKQEAVDSVTVTNELVKRKWLDAAGGSSYISQLSGSAPSVRAVTNYAKIVRDTAVLRAIAHANLALQNAATSGEESPREVLDRFEQTLYDLRESETQAEGPISLAQAVEQSWDQLEGMAKAREGVMLGASTGFKHLDQMIAGLVPREYIVLGARPSQGKTAMALRFCQNLAKQDPPQASAIFSLEMDKLALLIRLACMHGEVDGHKMRAGMLTKAEWAKFMRALSEVRQWPVYIHDPGSLSSARIISLTRRLAERKKIRLAIVDYVQLVKAPGRDMREQISRVSQDMRRCANILGKVSGGTLVVMSQLTRAAAKSGEPELEDLKESGSLEQEADTVLFLYPRGKRPKDAPVTAPVRKWLKVAKQRNGPTGRIEMQYLSHWLRFEEAAPERYEEPEPEPPGEEVPF